MLITAEVAPLLLRPHWQLVQTDTVTCSLRDNWWHPSMCYLYTAAARGVLRQQPPQQQVLSLLAASGSAH